MVAAKVHSQQSKRVKAKTFGEETKRNTEGHKTVSKSILTSPVHIQWPTIPANLQNLLYAHTVEILERSEIANYHLCRRSISRTKVRGVVIKKDGQETGSQTSMTRPALLDHTHIGVNAVTKKLEAQCRCQVATRPLAVILVCREDLQPPGLVDHLPQLIASCNANAVSRKEDESLVRLVRLVTFPIGSEDRIASAMGLHRTSVLGFDTEAPGIENLLSLTETVPVPMHDATFMKSRIIQLKRSATRKTYGDS